MKFDLIKQKCKVSSYKIDGEYTEYEVEGHIFYVKGIPAFMILKNGEIDETDPITPNGCGIYYNNKEFVDEWLKNNFANVARQVRH